MDTPQGLQVELVERLCDKIGMPHAGRLLGLLARHLNNTPENSHAALLLLHDTLLTGSHDAKHCFAVESLQLALIGQWKGMPDVYDFNGNYVVRDVQYEFEPEDRKQIDIFFKVIISESDFRLLYADTVAEFAIIYDKIAQCAGNQKGKKSAGRILFFLRSMVPLYLCSCLLAAKGKPISMSYNWGSLVRGMETFIQSLTRDTPIEQFKSRVSESCKGNSFLNPFVTTLIAPEWAERTRSALRFALHHAEKYKTAHIFIISPYNAALEKHAEDFRKIWGGIAEDILFEHHGDIFSDELGINSFHWEEPIVTLNIMRFMYIFLKGPRHGQRHIHEFANSILIFDGIERIPYQCTYLFTGICEFLHTVCNCSILLTSAMKPHYEHFPIQFVSTGPDLAGITDAELSMIKKVAIVDKIDTAGPMNGEALAKLVWKDPEKSILVIHNTKHAAEATFLALKEKAENDSQIKVLLLDGNLCPSHRKNKIEEFWKAKAKNYKKIFLVTTSMVEYGVDIYVDSIYRSKIGLPSIIASAEHCNRDADGTISHFLYLFESAEEALSSIPDIRAGQNALDSVRYSQKEFGFDLLSAESIDLYYRYLTDDRGTDKLSYPIDIHDVPSDEASLYSLMSINPTPAEIRASRVNADFSAFPIRAAYKTTFKLFKMMDYSKTVVIPYGQEAEKLIQDVQMGIINRKTLKKLCKYFVHLNVGFYRKLEDQALVAPLWEGGNTLQKAAFDDDIGIRISLIEE